MSVRGVVLIAVFLFPMQALAGNASFCRSVTDGFANWVIDTKRNIRSARSIDELQMDIIRKQTYSGIAERLSSRANYLLDKDLSPSEIKAELYGYCMSQT